MTQTAALQLVSSPKSSRIKIKRESKSEMIARLESNISNLQSTLAQKEQKSQEIAAELDKALNPEQSEVVENVKSAFRPKNRLAALWGLVKGGWAPLASFVVAHQEIKQDYYQPLTILVIGALLFSAPTVYEWCVAAFHNRAKALGFVVLLEGVMVFSHIEWLSYSALALLIIINGIQSACNLAIRQKKNEFQF